ncbi:MAG TPA: 3-keto-5-aminohexanoate cleavage protein [Allosphingosinicella sp.]|nr:3-keto-5-aminohexanoate cleavage protein [Allosphingosinicella sp.]
MDIDNRKLWLEVALNGGWGRKLQPLIPVSVREIVEEGIACVRAGASIVHFHAYDEASGRPSDDAELYAAVIEGIREQVDAIVYPTIAFEGEDRHAFVEILARRRLLEWAALDTGSVNLSRFVDIDAGKTGTIYSNDERGMRRGLRLAADYGFHPSFACYEPGFIRLGAALHRVVPNIPRPVYRLMFSDGLAFGFPPDRYALTAYRQLLATEAPDAPTMVAGLDVDLSPLMDDALDAGMHWRVGLEDAPLASQTGNLTLVEKAAARMAHRLATPADVRAALNSHQTDAGSGL